jgi:hypothetical protein
MGNLPGEMPLLSYKTGWLGELEEESFGVDSSPVFCFESPGGKKIEDPGQEWYNVCL